MLHRARQPPGAAGWAGRRRREGIWGGENEQLGRGAGGLRPLPPRRPQGRPPRTGVEGRWGGSRSPLRGAASGRSILEGAGVGAGAQESGLGTLCHIPVSLGLGP